MTEKQMTKLYKRKVQINFILMWYP